MQVLSFITRDDTRGRFWVKHSALSIRPLTNVCGVSSVVPSVDYSGYWLVTCRFGVDPNVVISRVRELAEVACAAPTVQWSLESIYSTTARCSVTPSELALNSYDALKRLAEVTHVTVGFRGLEIHRRCDAAWGGTFAAVERVLASNHSADAARPAVNPPKAQRHIPAYVQYVDGDENKRKYGYRPATQSTDLERIKDLRGVKCARLSAGHILVEKRADCLWGPIHHNIVNVLAYETAPPSLEERSHTVYVKTMGGSHWSNLSDGAKQAWADVVKYIKES